MAFTTHEHSLTLVATYQRTIGASLARVWENVLDWEHLPWLHRTSFHAIRLLETNHNGWRARVTIPSSSDELGIDVTLDRTNLRYLTRTTDGPGAGTEILTRLDPAGDHATRIAVQFWLPEVTPDQTAAIGDAYLNLYARLWDEDEGMMVRRQALLDGALAPRKAANAAHHSLGSVDALRSRLPLVVECNGLPFRVVEIDGRLLAHATVCPHLGGPLDAVGIKGGCITCPWHGYRFEVATGRNADGRECRLDPAPRVEVDRERGEAVLVWPTR